MQYNTVIHSNSNHIFYVSMLENKEVKQGQKYVQQENIGKDFELYF